MASFISTLNNLSWNVTSGALAHTIGGALDTLQSKLANGGRDQKVKFYWDYDKGGAIFNVIARSIVGGAVSEVSSEVMSVYKKLIDGTKLDLKRESAELQLQTHLEAQKSEEEKYGFVYVNNGETDKIEALDDWGDVCVDALMLSIPVANPVKITRSKSNGGSIVQTTIYSDHLVWYDTTALINVSSGKDLILTRVTGRDYSRKELVSNGDLNFSVSGHITSGIPDIYPTEEVQKFRQVMQYKGIIEVNNMILDQWGIKKIVVKSFSLPSSEGNKSIQDYSFEAVGIQPDTEANVQEDTVSIIDFTLQQETDNSESLSWKNMLKTQLENLKSQSVDLASQGLALAGGLLDSAIAKEDD